MTNLFLDIETNPIPIHQNEYESRLASIQPPKTYKKQETIDNWIENNQLQEFEVQFRKGALNALHGEIVSIAYGFDDEDIKCITQGDVEAIERFSGAHQDKEIIAMFYSDLHNQIYRHENESKKFHPIKFIGHNIIDFDLRFLHQRSMITQLKPPCPIPCNARHGSSDFVFDTMKEWVGYRGYVKLDDLAKSFHLDSKIMDGSDVFDLVKQKDWITLKEYNISDVEITRNLFNKMMVQ